MCQPRFAVDGWSFRGGVCSLCDSGRVMLRQRVPCALKRAVPEPSRRRRCKVELSAVRGEACAVRARGTQPPAREETTCSACRARRVTLWPSGRPQWHNPPKRGPKTSRCHGSRQLILLSILDAGSESCRRLTVSAG